MIWAASLYAIGGIAYAVQRIWTLWRDPVCTFTKWEAVAFTALAVVAWPFLLAFTIWGR